MPGLRVDLQLDYADTFQGRFSIADPPAPLGDPLFAAFDPFGGVSFGFTDRSDYEVIRPILRVDTAISDSLTLTVIATYEDVRSDREIGDLSDYEHASGFFADTTVSYSSEYFSGVANLDVNKAGDFTLVNARVGYRTASVEVYLFGENLFDSRAITEQSLVAVPAASGVETIETGPLIRVNRPRVYGLGLSFRM